MNSQHLNRRQLLAAGAVAGSGVLCRQHASAARPSESRVGSQSKSRAAPQTGQFRFCFNTSTIRARKLGLSEEVRIAAQAGYTGIEPWIREIETFVKDGGNLKDLAKQIADAGLTVESAIGFAQWIVDHDDRRKVAFEQAKRDMDLVRQIGGARIAAPPTGATRQSGMNLLVVAERYRALLDIGSQIGVVPQVEVWGFSQTLSRLGEAVLVAIESGHPDACVLPDVYHIFRGGSDFAGLNLLSRNAIHVFHINDYPDTPERTQMKDADRVYPGDGVAPLESIVQTLDQNGTHCAFSLELFNPDYWKQDPATVARTGLEKSRAVVSRALQSRGSE